MLHNFPDFVKLSTQEILNLGQEIHALDSRSDFAPAYILPFHDYDNKLEFCRLNNNLLARYYDIDVGSMLYSIQGLNKIEQSVKTLFRYQKQNKVNQLISHIDENQFNILQNCSKISLNEDIDSKEYIISTKDHAQLTNPKIKDEAMHVRSFIRNYGNDVKIFEIDLKKPNDIATVINHWHVWNSHYKNNNNDLDCKEREQISIFFKEAPNLPSRCLVISYQEQIVGFTIFDIYEHLSTAGGHHLKVDYAYNHAFDFLIYALCSKLSTEGIEYINIECDLGISGLRYKKHSLLPVDFIRFYTATPKP